jgi:hypothetical protein
MCGYGHLLVYARVCMYVYGYTYICVCVDTYINSLVAT